MVITVGFFGGMALWCIATPHSAISVHDGHCRIGSDMIPSYTTFSTDIVINIALTGVFIWLILPVLKNQARGPAMIIDGAARPSALGPFAWRRFMRSNVERDDPLAFSIKKMLKRNIIGSGLTFLAGAINLVIYFVDATSQIAFVCFTLCIVDVVFGVLVVQWLTFGSHEPATNSNQLPRVANLADSQMVYPPSRPKPESSKLYTKEPKRVSRCDMSFITKPENLNSESTASI
ncbi:hypothetical protein yc1106_01930 [Curvularia clavata]|uniref:Uncharacterized protein n=1 Tax=Curvularia clavata TaxID=95742 RepID=A0A9Q8Z2D3_CURCL|nr:hypothetical protein yc1106_01930 [Curvularia clavata]